MAPNKPAVTTYLGHCEAPRRFCAGKSAQQQRRLLLSISEFEILQLICVHHQFSNKYTDQPSSGTDTESERNYLHGAKESFFRTWVARNNSKGSPSRWQEHACFVERAKFVAIRYVLVVVHVPPMARTVCTSMKHQVKGTGIGNL